MSFAPSDYFINDEQLRSILTKNPVGADGKRGAGTLKLAGKHISIGMSGDPLLGLDMRDCDLTGAVLGGEWRLVRFDGCDMTGADASKAEFHGCDFTGANIAGMNLENARIPSAALLKARNWHLARYGAQPPGGLLLPEDHAKRLATRDFSNGQFDRLDLRGFDFTGCNLAGANFSGSDIFGADFTGAQVEACQLKPAKNWFWAFYGADGGETGRQLRQDLKLPPGYYRKTRKMARTDLTGLDLRDNDFAGVPLKDANLAHADLSGIDFSGCEMTNADLRWTNLSRANLSAASGLEAWQFQGADTSAAKLPKEIAEFKGLDLIGKVVPMASRQFLGLLAACLYSGLTIANTSDAALVLGSEKQQLPIVQTQIPILEFYIFAPLLLLVAFLYFLLHLHRMWEALAKLPAVFPDGRRLDERAYPWMLVQKIRKYFPRLRDSYTLVPRVEAVLGSTLAYGAVPATLLLFGARCMVRHSAALTVWQGACYVVAVVAGLGFLALGKALLRDARRGPSASEVVRRIVMAAVFIIVPVGAALALRWPAADLEHAQLSKPPEGWEEGQENLKGVIGARLSYADLRGSHAFSSFLAKADLRSASLDGAALSLADLREADLSNAHLAGADLSLADLRGAKLEGVDLTNCNLNGANVDRADLSSSRADSDSLKTTVNWALASYLPRTLKSLGLPEDHNKRLKMLDFRGYKLIDANFYKAQLAGFNFEQANLMGANLSQANLSGANLRAADLRFADFYLANLSKADLRGADLSDAKHLTTAQLGDAILDDATRLPQNLRELDRRAGGAAAAPGARAANR